MLPSGVCSRRIGPADAMIDAAELGLKKDAESAKWPPITAMGYIEERVAATYSA